MIVPRHFHFVFGLKKQTEPFHLSHYLCLASCLAVNRPDRITLHYHHEPYGRYWDLIKDQIELRKVDLPSVVRDFEYEDVAIGAKYRYAHHADFVRVDRLIAHGGVYADIDTLFVRELPERLFGHEAVFGREDDVFCDRRQALRPSVCNALIMARRASPFLEELRSRMGRAFDGSWSAHSCFLIHDLASEMAEAVHLEPPRSFYPFMWTRDDLELLFELYVPLNDDVYSIHMWSHLWWERGRRDFSRFWAGKITERRVALVDTTYNVLARPFLPPAERRWWSPRR